MAARTTVHIVHYDNQKTEMDKQVESLGKVNQLSVTYQGFEANRVCWGEFRKAVLSSKADILVVAIHGNNSGTIGPIPSQPFRSISSVFPAGTAYIQASTLILFSCHQWNNVGEWRKVAPNSTIIANDSPVAGVVRLIKKLNRVDPEQIETGALKKIEGKVGVWHILRPGELPPQV